MLEAEQMGKSEDMSNFNMGHFVIASRLGWNVLKTVVFPVRWQSDHTKSSPKKDHQQTSDRI